MHPTPPSAALPAPPEGLPLLDFLAAVVGDAENINKQARNERKDWLNSSARANWVKNKQEANGFLRSAPVGGARAA